MNRNIDKSLIIKEIKLHYGIKKDVEFAEFLGIPQPTLASWIKRNSFDYELIIEKCPEIDANWLITGKGEMIREKKSNIVAEPNEVYNTRTDNNIDSQRIPLYSLEAAAGIVQLFKDSKPTKDYIVIPNLPKCDGSMYISGDSMYPLLKSGDIVAYKQIKDIRNYSFIWGEMYIINFQTDGDDYTTVKYIQPAENDETKIMLISQNEHHKPITILKQHIRALALVKASVRINGMN